MQYYENEFTLWDRFEVQGDITLKEFMDYFQVNTQSVRLWGVAKFSAGWVRRQDLVFICEIAH